MTQVFKDFIRLLNDTRITWSSKVSHTDGTVTMYRVKNATLSDDAPRITALCIDYNNMIDKVKEVIALVPSRTDATLLYSLRYNHAGSVRRYSLAITSHANYEMHGVRHTRIGHSLGEALYTAIIRDELNVINHCSDGFVTHGVKSGCYQFYIGNGDE